MPVNVILVGLFRSIRPAQIDMGVSADDADSSATSSTLEYKNAGLKMFFCVRLFFCFLFFPHYKLFLADNNLTNV